MAANIRLKMNCATNQNKNVEHETLKRQKSRILHLKLWVSFKKNYFWCNKCTRKCTNKTSKPFILTMKNAIMALRSALLLAGNLSAQKVAYEEYDLDTGLHVILHNGNSAPAVITSVMYHVGAKDEHPDRTGFAHFFEHLLFEGTKNIG